MWRLLLPILGVAAILPHDIAADAAGPTTSVQGEYLMTLCVPIAEAHDVFFAEATFKMLPNAACAGRLIGAAFSFKHA